MPDHINPSRSRAEDFGEILEGVEILRTGTHTAAGGEEVTISDMDLSDIAGSYDPNYHEAPVVIGHPADNQPAYGWVKSLEAVGNRLLATLDLAPQFVETIREGLFKKRSASIYKNLDGKGIYLRHVGFLGAAPPAVKALADINLSGDSSESLTIEFQERKQPMSWKDWFKKAIDEMPEDGGTTPPVKVVQFSEEDVKAREKAAAEAAAKKAREETEAEFAEKMSNLESVRASKENKNKIKARLDELAKTGKILPAWRKSGLDQFAETLSWRSEAEGGPVLNLSEDKKGSPLDWFLNFLETLPNAVDLKEFAGKDKDVPATGGAGAKLAALIKAKQDKDPQLGYVTAFCEVQREHPELAAQYQEEALKR